MNLNEGKMNSFSTLGIVLVLFAINITLTSLVREIRELHDTLREMNNESNT